MESMVERRMTRMFGVFQTNANISNQITKMEINHLGLLVGDFMHTCYNIYLILAIFNVLYSLMYRVS